MSYSISVLSTDHAPLAVLGRVTSVELALLAVLHVPTMTLTPNPMPYDPKNGNIPARRETRPPPRAPTEQISLQTLHNGESRPHVQTLDWNTVS